MSATSSSSDMSKAKEPPRGEDVEKRQAGSPPEVDEAEANFKPKTFKFWLVIIPVFLALFLVALDRTIISTAVPTIADEFHSLGDIGWYGSAYQLTTAASQLIFGRIYRFYDAKKVFLACVFIFEIGSLICATAPSSIAFIIGRAIAGFGGAGIFSGSQILMIPMIPLRKRPMFQGVFGMVFGVSSVLGPLVGGAFTDGPSWRWCFYINLPIGVVAFICLFLVLKPQRSKARQTTLWEQFIRLDPLGALFFMPSIVCLLLALQWGGTEYLWNSPKVIALLVVFGVLWVAFLAVQVLLPTTATVPVRIIKRRTIWSGALFSFCLAGSMLMTIYYLPLWFQTVEQTDAITSGIYTIPFVLSMVVASILSGIFTQKVGYYVPAMIVSPSLLAVGEGLMSTFRRGEPASHWIAFEFLGGFGLGTGLQAANLAVQTTLPKPDIPTGISIMFFAQQVGGAIFTSVGSNLLNNQLASGLSSIPGVTIASIGSEGATNIIQSLKGSKYFDLALEVYNHAVTRIFLGAMGLALGGTVAALFVEWKNVKKTGPKAPQPAGASSPPSAPTPLEPFDLPTNPTPTAYPDYSVSRLTFVDDSARQSTYKPYDDSRNQSFEKQLKRKPVASRDLTTELALTGGLTQSEPGRTSQGSRESWFLENRVQMLEKRNSELEQNLLQAINDHSQSLARITGLLTTALSLRTSDQIPEEEETETGHRRVRSAEYPSSRPPTSSPETSSRRFTTTTADHFAGRFPERLSQAPTESSIDQLPELAMTAPAASNRRFSTANTMSEIPEQPVIERPLVRLSQAPTLAPPESPF